MPPGPGRKPKQPETGKRAGPPGRVKIIKAFRSLLNEKGFQDTTWADIAQTAGVNEGLIYKYFQDKRGLLHQVLSETFQRTSEKAVFGVQGIEGALNKLRHVIGNHIAWYNDDRVVARILMLEARNHPGFFETEAYQDVRDYTRFVLGLIIEGVASGEIRDDVPPEVIRQVIMGVIEHLCLPTILFDRPMDPDQMTEYAYQIVVSGIGGRRTPVETDRAGA
ncbi:MAG: TetR/AcrR family transcriptional regulator [Proteobacteria bacterium]|nr:TetR/AcrR family transcriptional regulator [Pseudomonadota bacterium]